MPYAGSIPRNISKAEKDRLVKERLQRARTAAGNRMSLQEFCRQEQIIEELMEQLMNKHDRALKEKFRKNGDDRNLPRPVLLHRLRTIHRMRRERASEGAIAKALGLSPPALTGFCKRWIPETTERALEKFFLGF